MPTAMKVIVATAALTLCLIGGRTWSETPDGLTLPDGFSASVYHEGLGARARHLAVRDNGDLFVSMRDGKLHALRDTDGDGDADQVQERKLPISTGLQIHDGYVYFSDNVSVSRVALDDGLLPGGDAETMVSGFPVQGQHAAKAIAINDDELFVNVGAPSNACQVKQRTPGSPGAQPCTQLERQAAIWKFNATRVGQDQLDGERYLTGIRNVVAMGWNDETRSLYFAMHGRDQLGTLWPEYFDDEDNAEMPAEEFHQAVRGADYGWPGTFVDPRTGKRLVAPEFGGNGRKEAEKGAYQTPLHAYPAHWAPNDLQFYHAGQFPERYHGGVFIAWRGSWNRAPMPQDGYRITFQPLSDGVVTGPPQDFMTGFKGRDVLRRPSDASYRPGGLALGPDGALYITEAIKGRIWKVTYTGTD